MADPTGFLTHRQRELAPKRPVPLRLMDWSEVQEASAMSMAQRQASRCMDCGVAFCHQGCPLGNLIPEWNDLLYQGDVRDALERLHATNNFPEFTGRVCPAPCESACVLGINQPPVTIKQSEVTIIDQGFAHGWVVPIPPERLTGTTVAVVGSGPAGLAAAQQLTRAGHTVAVYEKDERPGGLLRFGIPDFKLEKHLIDRRVQQMREEGTRFRLGVEIGVDMSWSELRRRYDAVLVATGAQQPRELEVPGRSLSGVHFAMDFLSQANRVVAGLSDQPAIDAAGKHVIVIGGGDTGSDCVGTAMRQGAASVLNLAIGRKPPRERDAGQPWPTHSVLYEVSTSHEEGGERRFLASTVSFIGDDAGGVRGITVAETGFSSGGRQPIPGTEHVFTADLVLIAMGFTGPEPINEQELTVQLAGRGFARETDYSTEQDGLFVAGDAGRGQSLIVWAIAEGRSAAAAIDRYLTGRSSLPAPVGAADRSFA